MVRKGLFLPLLALSGLILLQGGCQKQEPAANRDTTSAHKTAATPSETPPSGKTPLQDLTSPPTLRVRVGAPQVSFASFEDRLGYAFGVNVGQWMKRGGIEIVQEPFRQGFEDALFQRSMVLSDAEIRQTLNQFSSSQQARMKQKNEARDQENESVARQYKEEAARNLTMSKIFLDENKRKPGVVELPSGLQYRILREGTGANPKVTDKVKIHYRGTYINGDEFASSYSRGKGVVMAANAKMKGWAEALPLMKEGAKWELYVPPHLGYGEGGPGDKTPPNSALILEMELLEVVK